MKKREKRYNNTWRGSTLRFGDLVIEIHRDGGE